MIVEMNCFYTVFYFLPLTLDLVYAFYQMESLQLQMYSRLDHSQDYMQNEWKWIKNEFSLCILLQHRLCYFIFVLNRLDYVPLLYYCSKYCKSIWMNIHLLCIVFWLLKGSRPENVSEDALPCSALSWWKTATLPETGQPLLW